MHSDGEDESVSPGRSPGQPSSQPVKASRPAVSRTEGSQSFSADTINYFASAQQKVEKGGHGSLGKVAMSANGYSDPSPSKKQTTDPSNEPPNNEFRQRKDTWFKAGRIFQQLKQNGDIEHEYVLIDDTGHHRIALVIMQHEAHDEESHFDCSHLPLMGWMDYEGKSAERKKSGGKTLLFLRDNCKHIRVPDHTEIDLDHEHLIEGGSRCKETMQLDPDSLSDLRKHYLLRKCENWGIKRRDLIET